MPQDSRRARAWQVRFGLRVGSSPHLAVILVSDCVISAPVWMRLAQQQISGALIGAYPFSDRGPYPVAITVQHPMPASCLPRELPPLWIEPQSNASPRGDCGCRELVVSAVGHRFTTCNTSVPTRQTTPIKSDGPYPLPSATLTRTTLKCDVPIATQILDQ